MLAYERPWLRSLWPGPRLRPRRLPPRSLTSRRAGRSETKLQLLKDLGVFGGSGSAQDVRTLIHELERLDSEPSLRGQWNLIGLQLSLRRRVGETLGVSGDTASSRPMLLSPGEAAPKLLR